MDALELFSSDPKENTQKGGLIMSTISQVGGGGYYPSSSDGPSVSGSSGGAAPQARPTLDVQDFVSVSTEAAKKFAQNHGVQLDTGKLQEAFSHIGERLSSQLGQGVAPDALKVPGIRIYDDGRVTYGDGSDIGGTNRPPEVDDNNKNRVDIDSFVKNGLSAITAGAPEGVAIDQTALVKLLKEQAESLNNQIASGVSPDHLKLFAISINGRDGSVEKLDGASFGMGGALPGPAKPGSRLDIRS